MKKIWRNKIVQIGLTVFCVASACILFTLCLFNLKGLFSSFLGLINILMPLVFGLVMAYIMHPIVNFFDKVVLNKIEKDTTRRNLSITFTLLIIFGVLATLISIIIPQLIESIESLIVNAPIYLKEAEEWILNYLHDRADLQASIVANYDSVVEYVTTALNNIVLPFADTVFNKLSTGIFNIVQFIFNLAVGTVFAVYILANTKNFGAGIRKTLYSFFEVEGVNHFIDEVKHINSVFSHFMIGKVCDSSLVALTTFLFLLIFDFPYPLLIAVIIGLTDLIPYFGPYIGTIPSAILISLVSPVRAITFIFFIIILQQIDGNLITPRIQKQATGLPSFWVLFAITLFGGLFGVVGLLIGVPCFTIIYELCTDFIRDRLKEKELPTDTDYYMHRELIPQKVVKSKKLSEK